MEEVTTNNTKEEIELRPLCADDTFIMLNILSKIGIRELKNSIDIDSLRALKDGADSTSAVSNFSVGFALDLADIVLRNLSKCKDDIYDLLSALSGKTEKQIAKLPMSAFLRMVTAVFRDPCFADFFGEVGKLL